MIPSRPLSVSHAYIDPVGNHAPHQLVSELELSLPPLLSTLRHSLSPYRAGIGRSVDLRYMQVDTQDAEE